MSKSDCEFEIGPDALLTFWHYDLLHAYDANKYGSDSAVVF